MLQDGEKLNNRWGFTILEISNILIFLLFFFSLSNDSCWKGIFILHLQIPNQSLKIFNDLCATATMVRHYESSKTWEIHRVKTYSVSTSYWTDKFYLITRFTLLFVFRFWCVFEHLSPPASSVFRHTFLREYGSYRYFLLCPQSLYMEFWNISHKSYDKK